MSEKMKTLLKNGENLIIRKAKKADAKALLDYLKMVGGQSDNLLFGAEGLSMTVEQEEELIENLQHSETSALLIGLIDNRIVCVCSASASVKERISHQCNLAISVLKEFWGMGVGTCLMQAMIDFAKATEKLEILHLGVKADNVVAIALYKKMGFQEIGRYPKFFKIDGCYYDEILMNLYLYS